MNRNEIREVFKNGHLVDKIDAVRYYIAGLMCLFTVCIYTNNYMLSIRGAISDTISSSSAYTWDNRFVDRFIDEFKRRFYFFQKGETI